MTDLRNKVAMTAPDSRVTMQIMRNGHRKTIKVVIGEQPSDFSRRTKGHGGAGNSSLLDKMGLTLQELTPEIAQQFGYEKKQGVLIARVAQGSPAASVGLQSGQLFEEVNKVRVHTLAELKKALKKAKNPKQILLRVRAGDFSQYVVLRAK